MADIINCSSIFSGGNTTYILDTNNDIWGTGENQYGQLGLGTTSSRIYYFTKCKTDNVVRVYPGAYHTMILRNDGYFWGVGDNNFGQLLNNSGSYRTSWVKLNLNLKDVLHDTILIGAHYVAYKKSDGYIYGFGDNRYGSLARYDYNHTSIFRSEIPVYTRDNISSVAIGSHTTYVYNPSSNIAYSVGYNGRGECGQNSGTETITSFGRVAYYESSPILKMYGYNQHCVFYNTNGDIYAFGNNYDGALGVGGYRGYQRKPILLTSINMSDVKKIISSGCANHTLFIKNDDTLWGCGPNNYYQLYLPSRSSVFTPTYITDDVVDAYTGYNHTVIFKKDGSIILSGSNQYGQLGLGPSKSYSEGEVSKDISVGKIDPTIGEFEYMNSIDYNIEDLRFK